MSEMLCSVQVALRPVNSTLLGFQSLQLQKFDNIQRSLLADIVNICLHTTDLASVQAVLPVSSGGLGVWRAAQLGFSDFLLV